MQVQMQQILERSELGQFRNCHLCIVCIEKYCYILCNTRAGKNIGPTIVKKYASLQLKVQCVGCSDI